MFTKKTRNQIDNDFVSTPRSVTLHTMEQKLDFSWRLLIATGVLINEKEARIIERRIQRKLKEKGKN